MQADASPIPEYLRRQMRGRQREYTHTRPNATNFHQMKNVSFDVNVPTIFHITERIRIYEMALNDRLQQLRDEYIVEFGQPPTRPRRDHPDTIRRFPDGSTMRGSQRPQRRSRGLLDHSASHPPSKRDRSDRHDGHDSQRKKGRGNLTKAQQRDESRLATARHTQNNTRDYNALRLGPPIPIARNPLDQTALRHAHDALERNNDTIYRLATEVANQLRSAPRTRTRYPHLSSIVQNQDLREGEALEDAQHLQDFERHSTHLGRNFANQIRALSAHPPTNIQNTQDGGTDRPPRPPVPGSESEHDSE